VSEAELIGERLREAREARELTLGETERATRIRARHLEALEQGDYSGMTPVQAQGFLRNYARFLGLDFDLLLAEIAEDKGRAWRLRTLLPAGSRETPEPQTGRSLPHPVPPAARPPAYRPRMRRARRGFLGNILIVVIAGAVVVALIIGVTQLFNMLANSETRSDTDFIGSPSAPSEGEAVFSPGQTTTPADLLTPSPGFTPPTLTGTGVTVMIEIMQRTWIRITVDGAVAYESMANEGEILNFTAQQSIGVRANNAAGLKLTVNNQPQGILGGRGELFDQTFTLEGAGGSTGLAIPSGDPVLDLSLTATAAALFASPAASPSEAALFFTPTSTLPLDPGDGSVLSEGTPTLESTATSAETPTPEPTATAAPTLTPEPTQPPSATPEPSEPPSTTPTIAPTHTPAPSATPTATLTPSRIVPPTATLRPAATATRTSTLTATATLFPTRTPTATATPTSTATRTPTPTPSPTPSWSPTPSPTPTHTPFLPPRFTRTPSPAPK
jgi:transcriptional regulator with XRE-family HTH domain